MAALPNLYLSKQPIQVTRSSGTFVSIEVSLGYELDAGEVEQALKEAATATDLSEPFVSDSTPCKRNSRANVPTWTRR